MRRGRFHDEDRGIISPLSHALTIGMTTVLLFGLILAAGTLLDDQREDATESELRTIGNRLASEIASADRAAKEGGNVTIESSQPARLASSDYSVAVRTGSACDRNRFDSETCLRLRSSDPDVTVHVPVLNDSAISIDSDGRGTVSVTIQGKGNSSTAGIQWADLSTTVGVADDESLNSPLGTVLGNRPPAAVFDFEPGSPWDGTTITFDAGGSLDPDGSIDVYRWDWDGDGGIDATTTNPIITKAFSAGTYDVTLKTEDDSGAKSSFTRTITIGGLVYNEDISTSNALGDEVGFTVTNAFSQEVRVTHVIVDPADDSIDKLNASVGVDEITVGASGFGEGDFDIYPGGRIIELNASGDISAGSTVDVALNGFEDGGGAIDMAGRNVTVGLKYEVGSEINGTEYTNTSSTRFSDAVGGTSILSYELDASGQDVDLVFESAAELDESTLEVELGGNASGTLDSDGDFAETSLASGAYRYEADVSSGVDGIFRANLTDGETEASEPIPDTPYNDSVLVATSGDYVWTDASDWDGATSSDGVVHASYGDRSPDQLELGYATDDDGLIAYYPLDDPGTDGDPVPDESAGGSNNQGTIEDDPAATRSIFGTDGYEFDGTDDYVEVPSSPELSGGSDLTLTATAWVYRDAPGSGAVITKQKDTSDGDWGLETFNGCAGWADCDGTSPYIGYYSEDGGDDYGPRYGDGVTDESWYHAAITVNHTTPRVRVYVDGTLVMEHTNADVDPSQYPFSANTSQAVEIGTRTYNDNYLSGMVDEVRVYNRTLNATEVNDLHGAATGGTLETDNKTGDTIAFDDAELRYDVETPLSGDSVEITVHTSNGTSDPITIDHSDPTGGVKEITGLPSGDSADEYHLEVELESPTLDSSPTVHTLEVAES